MSSFIGKNEQSLLRASEVNFFDLTNEQILMKKLSENTRKSYWSSIKTMMCYFSENERKEYINSDGYLKKSLSADLIDFVMRESQFVDDGNGKRKWKSTSSYNCYNSALSFWHKESDRLQIKGSTSIKMDEDAKGRINELSVSRKRIKARQVSTNGEDDSIGKRSITFSDYKFLSSLALSDPAFSLISHSSIVLGWNLMARSCSVSGLNWNNFAVCDDSITVFYHLGKTNQEGDKKAPISLYANPLDPLICPFLSLGIKVCSESFSASNPLRLYYSVSSSKTFSCWLQNILKGLNDSDLARLTVSPADIGTHSLRKGGANYVAGVVEGPDSDNIKMRMEHSLGRSDDAYFERQTGSDKYVGRTVCGLNIETQEFAAICPHFINDSTIDIAEAISSAFMESASLSAKAAVRLMIASVIYHWDWVIQNIHPDHPFLTSTIFTKKLNLKWKDCVTAGFFENKVTGMRASGLPRSSRIIYNQLKMSETMLNSPQATVDLLVEKLGSIDGITLTNEASLERIVNPEIRKLAAQMSELSARIPQGSGNGIQCDPNSVSGLKHYCWGGRFHYFPENFKIPRISPLKFWNLWLFGDGSIVTLPYHQLDGSFLSSNERCQLSKARKIMETIKTASGMSYEEIKLLGHVKALKMGQDKYEELFGNIDKSFRINFTTAYKLFVLKKI